MAFISQKEVILERLPVGEEIKEKMDFIKQSSMKKIIDEYIFLNKRLDTFKISDSFSNDVYVKKMNEFLNTFMLSLNGLYEEVQKEQEVKKQLQENISLNGESAVFLLLSKMANLKDKEPTEQELIILANDIENCKQMPDVVDDEEYMRFLNEAEGIIWDYQNALAENEEETQTKRRMMK